jgi:hypothetical protein
LLIRRWDMSILTDSGLEVMRSRFPTFSDESLLICRDSLLMRIVMGALDGSEELVSNTPPPNLQLAGEK